METHLHSERKYRISQIVNAMSQQYWENRYQTKDMPWEKGEGSPGLVDFLAAHPELPRGTVCVPGCGSGHDVRGWAKAGFEAYGFDIAPSAIELSIEKTKAAGIRLGEVKTGKGAGRLRNSTKKHAGGTPALPGSATYQLSDFLHDEPPFRFDWLFEHTLFCAIDPSQRDDYVRAVLRWLKPKGQFLAVHYMIPDTDGPPFGTTRDELWQRFSSHFDLRAEWVPRSYPNRTGLELVMWWGRK
jgi:methyl halide transferase